VSTVHVRYKVNIQSLLGVWLKGFSYHNGAKVRSTNTNVNDISNGLASVTLPFSTPHLLSELSHVSQNCIDIRHDVFAIDDHGLVAPVAKGCV